MAFKKGQSGNPGGRPPMTEEQRRMMKLTKSELIQVASYLIKGDKSELKKMVDDPKTSILNTWIASVAIKAIKNGDMDALDKLLTRIIGKPKEELAVTGNPVQLIVRMPSNGKEKA